MNAAPDKSLEGATEATCLTHTHAPRVRQVSTVVAGDHVHVFLAELGRTVKTRVRAAVTRVPCVQLENTIPTQALTLQVHARAVVLENSMRTKDRRMKASALNATKAHTTTHTDKHTALDVRWGLILTHMANHHALHALQGPIALPMEQTPSINASNALLESTATPWAPPQHRHASHATLVNPPTPPADPHATDVQQEAMHPAPDSANARPAPPARTAPFWGGPTPVITVLLAHSIQTEALPIQTQPAGRVPPEATDQAQASASVPSAPQASMQGLLARLRATCALLWALTPPPMAQCHARHASL